MKYELKTYITDEDWIVSEVWTDGYDNMMERITRQVLNTREEQVRRALIELGWTPPGEKR